MELLPKITGETNQKIKLRTQYCQECRPSNNVDSKVDINSFGISSSDILTRQLESREISLDNYCSQHFDLLFLSIHYLNIMHNTKHLLLLLFCIVYGQQSQFQGQLELMVSSARPESFSKHLIF